MYEWHDIRVEQPEDHEWVLIAHKHYGTPTKAKYHSDCGGMFTFFTSNKEGLCYERGSYIFDNEINYWTELPKLPDDYREDHHLS